MEQEKDVDMSVHGGRNETSNSYLIGCALAANWRPWSSRIRVAARRPSSAVAMTQAGLCYRCL
jgi:hypothetical protein